MTSLLTAGPWRLRGPLLDARENTIYFTHDPSIVVKIMPASCDDDTGREELIPELEIMLGVFNNSRQIRNAPSFPHTLANFCGTGSGYAWAAMRRYDGCVALRLGTSVCPEFCRRNWRRLGTQVLAFLEDFHTVCRRVHMDIKAGNILVDQESSAFVVSDFGLSTFTNSRPLSDYSHDFLWYYLEFGAELEKPLAAWKTDLVALGYLLARLTWNPDINDTFIEQARLARREGSLETRSPVSLMALRDSEMRRGACPIVRAYFDMLEELSWTATEPPPRSFYQRLAGTLRPS